MEVFRITHNKWSQNLSGSGYAARWNSQGVYMIYTAESRALACLENIVHRGSTNLSMPFLIKKILIHAEESILELPPELLPDEWNKNGEEGYILCRPFGNTWIKNSDSAVLKVPSAIIPGEFNYLINPRHEDFKMISIISEEPFFYTSSQF